MITKELIEGVEYFFAVVGAIGLALQRKGYLDIIKTKLKVHSTVAEEALAQDTDTALIKLQIPDDALSILESFEINESGQIRLKGHGRVNTLLNLNRPLTEAEKDEVIRVMRRVLS